MSPDPRYPIGKYEPQPYSQQQKDKWLLDLQLLPSDLENAVHNLDEAQLHTPYREGGWTVHQLMHHIADSHMNAYIRFKLGLTEDNPPIKPYEERLWAELNDVKILPINISVTLLFALHERWFATVKDLSEAEWMRTVFHPEHKKELTLWFLLGLYAWHGRHHVQHILSLRERMQWT
ncbi:putative metal-dependent hydrolase [Ilyomonas limi]|uniref:Putative metal-dependent hydrolase n=1 Tax=Ilyomonas limi TaxID=2575867 RepID=A0A4U3L2K2_9BACT|nr:putative metal-dependent hydrolase [Ilyomonas limi]TKK67786.1 putative metal-dependent hydrolase [Ilyomonas limi]